LKRRAAGAPSRIFCAVITPSSGHAAPGLQALARADLEGLVARQERGAGARLLALQIDAGRHDALLRERLGGADQAMARHDDAVVAADQILLGAVDDGAPDDP